MLLNQIDAGAWIRSVPNHVSETDDSIDAPLADVGKDNLKCFEIRVDVADDGSSHDTPMVPARRPGSNPKPG